MDPEWEGCAVPPTSKQRAEARRIAKSLAAVGFVLPGTMTERMTRCGKERCRCHDDPPQLHGPYNQWTRKVQGKTVTRLMNDEQLAEYGPWIDNEQRLRSLVTALERLTLGIVEADPRWER